MYTKTVNLNDNEGIAIINKETGEFKEVPPIRNHNPDVMSFKKGDKFIKTFSPAWEVLYNMTTPLEYKVAQRMSTTIKMISNSLEPLDDEMSYQELADHFSISKTKAHSVFKKLFELGVYGKFEVYDSNFKHTKYWVFNPYLAINGEAISKITHNLFSNTIFAKV